MKKKTKYNSCKNCRTHRFANFTILCFKFFKELEKLDDKSFSVAKHKKSSNRLTPLEQVVLFNKFRIPLVKDLHEHLPYKSYVMKRGQFMYLLGSKRLLNNYRHPTEQDTLWLFLQTK